MDIIINTNQLDRLKSTYRTKYVDDSDLYKGPPICNGVNQNLNKLKIIDIIEQYGELTHEYPNVFHREKPIGEGEDGSPIQLYTLNKTKTEKPIILIVGGVHGDEKTSIYGIYETVKFLLLGSKWSRFITSNFVVQIVPCLNVYGFNNNKRNNSNNKDLNRDFIKATQKETKALTDYIKKNKDRIKIILDSHNAYNEEFVSCKQEMKFFEEYEDVAFKLNLFLNGKYESDDKKSFLWISRSKNDGTLSDFINKNKFIGHTVESPRSLTKEIHYPNPINYEDGAEVTKDLLVNLMYIYGKMYNAKILTESKHRLYEDIINTNKTNIDDFIKIAKSYAQQALKMANNYLQPTNLSIDIDYEYDDWEFNGLDINHVIGCYEADSVFSGTIEISFNMNALYSTYKEQTEMYPYSNEDTILKELIYTNVFHEMGHGLIQQINDYLQETEELDEIYDNNQQLFDNALDNEEDTVEKFAWDLYDSRLNNNPLNRMVKMCLI